jgi:hypothetical protein
MSIRDIFDRAVIGSMRRRLEHGTLGKPLGDGQFELEIDENDPYRVYAVLERASGSTIIEVLNIIAPLVPELPILLSKTDDDQWIIVDIDWKRAQQSLGKKFQSLAVPPHNHNIGSGLEDSVESRRFEPGQVFPVDDLLVIIEPFWYLDSTGILTRYPGEESIDLTSYIPATAGNHVWIIIAVDKTTNLATVITGTERPSTVPLSVTDLPATTSDDIPLCGIWLRDDTTFVEESNFVDLRTFISSGGGGSGATNLDGLTDVVISSPADKHILIYDGVTDNIWENHLLSDYVFLESEFINSSAGAGDAGKPIVLDSGGLISGTMIDDSDIDHGSVGGLTDDDHSLYLLKSGLREWDEQGSDPSTPATTKWKLYFKSDGLYYIDDAGNVEGPLLEIPGSGFAPLNYTAIDITSTSTYAFLQYLLSSSDLGSTGFFDLFVLWRYFNNSGGSRTLTFTVNFGGALAVLTWSLGSIGSSGTAYRHGLIRIRVTSAGATNAQCIYGEYKLHSSSVVPGTFAAWATHNAAIGTATQDITTAKLLDATVQSSNGAATQTFERLGVWIGGPYNV